VQGARQGGHVEYFKYMVDMLRQRGGENMQVFGGGGGVIVHKGHSRVAADPWPLRRYALVTIRIGGGQRHRRHLRAGVNSRSTHSTHRRHGRG